MKLIYCSNEIQMTRNNSLLFFLIILSFCTFSVKSQPRSIQNERKNNLIGIASFYSNRFEGRKTASGDVFSQKKMTAACNKLPLGTYVRVVHLGNNKSVLVKINDRLHHKSKRLIDLSQSAAKRLNMLSGGLAKVCLEVITRKEFEQISDSSN